MGRLNCAEICMLSDAGTNQFYDNEAAASGPQAGVGESEMYPYVSFTLSIDG